MNTEKSTYEKQLVARLQKGDEEAFQEIFNAYFKMLYSYALNLLERPFLAEDIVEDVFFKIWERRKQLSISGSLTNYLFTSVKNACFDHIKSVKVRQNYEERIQKKIKLENSFVFNEISSADPLKQKELKQAIKDAIQKLPRDYRKVFKMSMYYKMTNKEIADKLGFSSHTVGKYLHFAMDRLRESLSDYFF